MNETGNWIVDAVELWVRCVKTRKEMLYHSIIGEVKKWKPEKLPPSGSAKTYAVAAGYNRQ
jgi:hypothetical protein